MKITFLKFMTLAGILALTGCSSEEIIDGATSGVSLESGENLVKISLTSTTTRSPRPIGGTEADNNIDRIAFKHVSTTSGDMTDAPIEGVYTRRTVRTLPSGYTVQDNVIMLPDLQNEVTVYIRFSTMMDEGRYNIVAYGYNSDGNEGFPYTMTAATTSDTDYMPISCTVESDDVVEEIFAGYCTVYVNQYREIYRSSRDKHEETGCRLAGLYGRRAGLCRHHKSSNGGNLDLRLYNGL